MELIPPEASSPKSQINKLFTLLNMLYRIINSRRRKQQSVLLIKYWGDQINER
jgi:hypothetical protein